MHTSTLQKDLAAQLDARNHEGLLRKRRTIGAWRGIEADIDGRSLASFCSNDYLGMARDPAVAEAAARATATWGAGAGSARLISGNYALLDTLEARLAEWMGTEAALVFPAGYMANLGAITALCGPDDTVVLDRLAHASLVDAARLSRARFRVFPHNDVDRLDAVIAKGCRGRVLVATESVFSMDGDRAPLAAIVACCARHGAVLLVDEAHAIGVYGGGRGLLAEEGCSADVTTGTLSKALGSQGGFVAGSRLLIEHLVNAARPFIYSTGIAPPAAGAALAALEELGRGTARIGRLWDNVRRLRAALAALDLPGDGPICPVVVGEAGAAVALADTLREKGYLVPAVRPPTVPRGRARVRVTVSAAHAATHVDEFARALAAAYTYVAT